LGLWVLALFADYLNVYFTGPDGWPLNQQVHADHS
jgi:hypothetical protein